MERLSPARLAAPTGARQASFSTAKIAPSCPRKAEAILCKVWNLVLRLSIGMCGVHFYRQYHLKTVKTIPDFLVGYNHYTILTFLDTESCHQPVRSKF